MTNNYRKKIVKKRSCVCLTMIFLTKVTENVTENVILRKITGPSKLFASFKSLNPLLMDLISKNYLFELSLNLHLTLTKICNQWSTKCQSI